MDNNNTMDSVIYSVNSDLDDGILYAEFETKEAAIEYATRNLDKLPFVDELKVTRDDEGEIADVLSYTTIWDHSMADGSEVESEGDYWDDLASMYDDSEKHDLGDTTWFESMDNLVETLEDNEDEVECKECFDLFPKADCIKVDIGYICPTCAEGGTVSEDEIFKIDFPEYEKMSVGNDMIPEDPMSEPAPTSEVEPEVEVDPISTPEEAVPFLVKDEEEAIAGYELAAEVVADSDLENKEEILDAIEHIKEEEEEHIEELTELVEPKEEEVSEDENDPVSDEEETETVEDSEAEPLTEDITSTKYWMCFYDGNDVCVVEADDEDAAMEQFVDSYSDSLHFDSWDHDWSVDEISKEEYDEYDSEYVGGYEYDNEFDYLVDKAIDSMREHVNEENPTIESEQELSGIDNAEVKCKTNPVVSHSKDELPVDSCDHEVLTEATTDELSEIFRLCKKLGLKTGGDLNNFVKEKVKPGENLLSVLRACCDGSSETSESLTEANAFKQISRISDPVDKIRMELENNGFGGYLAPQGSEHMFKPRELVDSAGFRYGLIQDLEVDANGIVYIRTSYRSISLDFAGKIVRGTKYNACRDLVKGIQNAVEVIDKAHRPTRAQQAAQAAADKLDAVSASLRANPEAVKELFDHVTNIEFRVPLQTDYEVILDDTDPDYEAAVKKLERLYERFMSLPFAQDAIATGVAVNREIRESDKLWQIAQRWYNEAVVTFDCKIGTMTKSKHIIEAAKVDAMSITGNTVDLDTTNSINCFNLAAALIMYFGKSDFFKDKKTYASKIPTPSTDVEEGIELTDIR